MTPSVSVVVPVYNGVAFIDATMQSILAQTFSDFELVVSDNASTDGTWEALQRYAADPRVRLTRLASTIPAAENFNHVTDLATGEFVKLVCADDVLYPDNLEVLVKELTAHPSALLAVSSRDVIDATGQDSVAQPRVGRTARGSHRHRRYPAQRARRHQHLRRAAIGLVQARRPDRCRRVGSSLPLSSWI